MSNTFKMEPMKVYRREWLARLMGNDDRTMRAKIKEGRPKLLLFDEISYEREKQELRHFTRVWMMDMVSLALGRMGFREKRFKQLDDSLLEVTKEYDKEFEDDIKDDPEMVYTRAALDRELKQYMGKLFCPEEGRY